MGKPRTANTFNEAMRVALEVIYPVRLTGTIAGNHVDVVVHNKSELAWRMDEMKFRNAIDTVEVHPHTGR